VQSIKILLNQKFFEKENLPGSKKRRVAFGEQAFRFFYFLENKNFGGLILPLDWNPWLNWTRERLLIGLLPTFKGLLLVPGFWRLGGNGR